MAIAGPKAKIFYGWPLVGVGFLIYGLGIGPGYYSWGFLAPELIAELGLTREQVGGIFGTFTLTFALISPLAALVIRRFGIRASVTAGALLAALGFGLVSRANSVPELIVTYALLGGVGVGLSCGLPVQTMCVNWFRRYRARAIAITMLGAAVVGGFVTPIDDVILRLWGWRVAWLLIAGISVLVAAIAIVFLRERPEDYGGLPDGERPAAEAAAVDTDTSRKWTALEAIRTWPFAIASLAATTNVVPWRVLSAHGRLHFEDLGFTPTVAAAILGVRVGVSGVGRLAGSMGDFLSPTRVMALSLLINGLGLVGVIFADSAPMAYLCVVLLGVGYGAGYISEPVLFARFFGRAAFVGTSGVRAVIIGIAGFFAPTWAGAAADRTGSYSMALAVLAAACFAGAVAIALCRPPTRAA
jgi:sugar phosphate permease